MNHHDPAEVARPAKSAGAWAGFARHTVTDWLEVLARASRRRPEAASPARPSGRSCWRFCVAPCSICWPRRHRAHDRSRRPAAATAAPRPLSDESESWAESLHREPALRGAPC
jgi:hypothetical protein